jgi:hypothetical protein
VKMLPALFYSMNRKRDMANWLCSQQECNSSFQLSEAIRSTTQDLYNEGKKNILPSWDVRAKTKSPKVSEIQEKAKVTICTLPTMP